MSWFLADKPRLTKTRESFADQVTNRNVESIVIQARFAMKGTENRIDKNRAFLSFLYELGDQ